MSELFELALFAQSPAAANPADAWWATGAAVGFVFLVFVLPFIVGSMLAKSFRMPTYGGRIGIVIATISATLLICWSGGFMPPLGVDIKGGTVLKYELVRGNADNAGVSAKDVVTALQNRLNPSGTKEISLRPYGESQIEVVVPNVDAFEVNGIKKLISEAGVLKFRILANTRDHGSIIDSARTQASDTRAALQRSVYNAEKRQVGEWYPIGRKDKQTNGVVPLRLGYSAQNTFRNAKTGQLIEPPALSNDRLAFEKWLANEKIEDVDVLTALERSGKPYELLSGDDLASAGSTYDKSGLPAVSFNLTSAGSGRMFGMTAANQPDGDFHRQMAIILDERVLSAPQLNSPISSNGIIEGNFTREEVDYMVKILRAGKLPASLSKEPISENRIGALLGATTIQKGAYASVLSLVVTIACILLYYRFSGIVAASALLLNGLMILAMMILIQQPLTLPGLAGAVLTLGMAVDANVLVFERMREEIQKGATTRMAIRNGFDRALTTITDSNLTTVISAVVLYWIGTDQVRGFAVALIIGILISMFTAVFCSRIVFDVAEKFRFANLSMSDGLGWLKKTLLGEKDVDFMSWQKFNVGASIVIILIGLSAIAYRGKEFLAIDFTGGTSVTFQLVKPLPADEVRGITKSIFDKDANGERIESTLQLMDQPPADSVYKLDTSVKKIEDLRARLIEGLKAHPDVNLVTYRVTAKVQPNAQATGFLNRTPDGRLTMVQDKDATNPLRSSDVDASATKPVASEPQAPTSADATSPDDAAPAKEATQPSTPADQPKGDTTTVPPAATTPSTPAADATAAAAATPAAPVIRTTLALSLAKNTETQAPATTATGEQPANPDDARMSYESLRERVVEAAKEAGLVLVNSQVAMTPTPIPDGWTPESTSGFSDWEIDLPFDAAETNKVAGILTEKIQAEPVWLSLSNIGERVAGDMQQQAIAALLISLIFIIAYIWFRFQNIAYGFAAVIALLHDVLITIGIVAMCHWLAAPLGFLMIEDFKIDLIMVAAFLTIIGYSLNDTIVVFDRIREVRGKSPRLTTSMINASVNQTLSRTLLTSSTTLMTIALLYFFGGEGIHGFSFALFVGIVVGTYSSIFIASPVLLWLAKKQQSPATSVVAPARMGSRPTV